MTRRSRAELFLLSCTIIWGGTFVVVKGGLEDSSPFLLIAIRFLVASGLFGILAFRSLGGMSRLALAKGAFLGALLFLGFALQTVGLQYTSASKSGFITGLLVVFTPIFQLLIERRPPKAANVLGIVLVVVGLYFLTAPEGAKFNIGDAMTLGCAAAFGLYIVYLDVFTKQHDVFQLTFLQFISTGIFALVGSFLEQVHFTPTVHLWFALAYLSLLATVYTLFVQTRYQRDTTPTRAALIFSLEPVFAAGLAYLVLQETIGLLGVLGGTLIILGLLVSQFAEPLLGRRRANDEMV